MFKLLLTLFTLLAPFANSYAKDTYCKRLQSLVDEIAGDDFLQKIADSKLGEKIDHESEEAQHNALTIGGKLKMISRILSCTKKDRDYATDLSEKFYAWVNIKEKGVPTPPVCEEKTCEEHTCEIPDAPACPTVNNTNTSTEVVLYQEPVTTWWDTLTSPYVLLPGMILGGIVCYLAYYGWSAIQQPGGGTTIICGGFDGDGGDGGDGGYNIIVNTGKKLWRGIPRREQVEVTTRGENLNNRGGYSRPQRKCTKNVNY